MSTSNLDQITKWIDAQMAVSRVGLKKRIKELKIKALEAKGEL